MEKETSRDGTDICKRQPLLKDAVSVCLISPLHTSITSANGTV